MSVLIDEYKRAEEARLEAERQRIRAEEERKAREAAERAAEEERKRIRAEEEEKAKAEAKLHAAQLDDAKPGIVPQTPAASISRQEAEKKTRILASYDGVGKEIQILHSDSSVHLVSAHIKQTFHL